MNCHCAKLGDVEVVVPRLRRSDRSSCRPAEDRRNSSLLPPPVRPTDYPNMWDRFVVRDSMGQPLASKSESDSQLRVVGGFDLLPWNGRPRVRDAQKNWLLLTQESKRILLAKAAGTFVRLSTGSSNVSSA